MTDKLVAAFENELGMFLDKRYEKVIRELMSELNDDILELPASTTGKYHPEDEIGKDGMIIHIKRACSLVEDAARKYQFSRYGQDVLLAGCLLHDVYKAGAAPTGDKKHTVTEHPWLVHNRIITQIQVLLSRDETGGDSDYIYQFLHDVATACAWHEGVWTTEMCADIVETELAKALHEIDFWVTRRKMWEIMQPQWVANLK